MNRLRTRLRASIADGPLVLLDFISGGLDPRITFSRGSNATLVDATGKITYAPNNLIPYSTDATNAAWGKSNATVVGGVSDPVGGTNAQTVTATANSAQLYSYVSIGSAIGTRYLYSVWVRRRSGSGGISLFRPDATSSLIAVTSTWKQFFVSSNGGFEFIYPGFLIGTSGDQIDVYFPVCAAVTYETAPRSGDQVATTASAYYGPRFDYDPVTLAPKGLLIEEARTNLVPYSSDFTNSSWVKSLSAMAGTFTAAPDGTNTGAKWREDSTNNQHAIYYATPTLTAAAYTETWYLKAAERTKVLVSLATAGLAYGASVIADLSAGTLSAVTNYGGHTGATATMSSASNGWYRVSITMTATAAVYYPALTMVTGTNTINYTGDGTSGIYIWGAQLELASFATSYIPTVASTVTRSADVATMTGTNFSSWYNQSEGTFVVNSAEAPAATAAAKSFAVANTANSNIIRGGKLNGATTAIAQLFNAGVGVGTATSANSLSLGALNKIAVGYKVDDFGISLNGGSVVVDTSVAIPTDINRLDIGQNGVGFAINGHVAQLAYYNTRLPNAQLQTLTAPSLATTLSLSFTNQAYTVGV